MPRDLIDDVRDFSAEQRDAAADTPPQSEQEAFQQKAREMVLLREQKARLAAREADLKKVLMAYMERYGEPYGPSNQHRAVIFDKPIRGIARFVRQSKVTQMVDETRAEAIARKLGIYDRLFRPVMQLDEAAVMVAVQEGILTDRDLDEIFPKKTVHAFVAEKKK